MLMDLGAVVSRPQPQHIDVLILTVANAHATSTLRQGAHMLSISEKNQDIKISILSVIN